MDELMARPGSFWLVFTCLAVDANVDAREEALEEGRRKGRREGFKKGRSSLIREMLHHQLVRHLRRELTPAEQRALSARAGTLSGPEVAELLAQGGSGSLASWLLGPTTGAGGVGESAQEAARRTTS